MKFKVNKLELHNLWVKIKDKPLPNSITLEGEPVVEETECSERAEGRNCKEDINGKCYYCDRDMLQTKLQEDCGHEKTCLTCELRHIEIKVTSSSHDIFIQDTKHSDNGITMTREEARFAIKEMKKHLNQIR